MQVEQLSDAELNQALKERGQGPFPITPNSRKVVERKLLKLIETEGSKENGLTGIETNGTKAVNGTLNGIEKIHESSPILEVIRQASLQRESPERQKSPPRHEELPEAEQEEEEEDYEGETSARYFSEEEKAAFRAGQHVVPKSRFYGSGLTILAILFLLGFMFKIVNDNVNKVYKNEL
ncbi:unnamed protein product [Bursaphelenchus okinawaensis]|uniref:LEM domain-containing protein n=1 Tax=Bursaphelenchus okinawaensis TaxID=465554 RepID=A0A811JTR1_9BILA|nr:unnamed protein product [Bursaphelenchus okinawaensis]CAG9083417.1 unnamed protein product [Bursaphelenchus okinawaensis]